MKCTFLFPKACTFIHVCPCQFLAEIKISEQSNTLLYHRMFRKIGPGVLVAAAFIGPGTVTVCTLAGVGFGYSLLWALLLAITATIVLQEMSARLGIISQIGLADSIRQNIPVPVLRYLVLGVILSAIVFGNAAYEAGNIGGASMGLESLFGAEYNYAYAWIIGLIAFALLWLGNYKVLERIFVGLVIIMSLSFLVTALLTGPDLGNLFRGLFIPRVSDDNLLTIIALVGTTVVPYNLFLHASLVSEKWKQARDLPSARWDTVVSVILGGLVSMSIVVAAAAIPTTEVRGVLDLARGLEPLYGTWATYFMGIGLFSAGITSAITAPLAAAYVANSCFGWKADLRDPRFRLVWALVLLSGVFSLSFGVHPIEIIQFAQVANGLLLPVVAVFLVWIVNNKRLMGTHRNTGTQNFLALLIIILSVVLGIRSILKVITSW